MTRSNLMVLAIKFGGDIISENILKISASHLSHCRVLTEEPKTPREPFNGSKEVGSAQKKQKLLALIYFQCASFHQIIQLNLPGSASSSPAYRHAGESAIHTWEFGNRCRTWESGSQTWGCGRERRSFHCVSWLPFKKTRPQCRFHCRLWLRNWTKIPYPDRTHNIIPTQ